MSKGVLYIASGEEYVSEAEYSARSVREAMPELSITLATEDHVDTDVFDDIVDIPERHPEYGVSTLHPDLIPYDRTLFLDSDTYMSEPVPGVFEILDDHDMAFTQSPGRLAVPDVPEPWVEFNTGVVSFKDCRGTREFLELWQKVYSDMVAEGINRNQPSFAKTVYRSELDYFILPREYNCRVPRFGYLVNKAKIVHGRNTVALEEISESLNANETPRVYWPDIKMNLDSDVKVLSETDIENKPMNILFRFKRSVEYNGWRHAFRESYKEIKSLVGL